jgi:hypothetical protein
MSRIVMIIRMVVLSKQSILLSRLQEVKASNGNNIQ